MKIGDWQKTCWQDDKGNKATINDVLLELNDEPVIKIKLTDLAHIPPTCIEEHRKLVADLSCPIIVVEKDGEFQYILDGHHRRQKAIDESKTCILGRIYRGEVINENR